MHSTAPAAARIRAEADVEGSADHLISENEANASMTADVKDLSGLIRLAEQRLDLPENSYEILVPSDESYFNSHEPCCAYVDGSTIVLRPDFERRPAFFKALVLLHELTHVAQKRRGQSRHFDLALSLDHAILEREAEAAALAILKGAALKVGLDQSSTRSHFEEDGHYYTTYYAAAAAGIPSATAARLAFYSQLPDLVGELDATTVFLLLGMSGQSRVSDLNGATDWRWLSRALSLGNINIPSFVISKILDQARLKEKSLNASEEYSNLYMRSIVNKPNYSVAAREFICNARRLCACVQIGLHSLTGNPALAEQKIRFNALQSYDLNADALQLGLAIHAYGDSYAHVDLKSSPARMYFSPCGHMKDEHVPDEIPTRPKEYAKFANSLRMFFSERSAMDLDKQMSTDDFVKSLIKFVFQPDKSKRIEALRLLILERYGNAFGVMDPYRPEDSKTDLWLLAKRTAKKGISLSTADLDTAFFCARIWANDIPTLGPANPSQGVAIPEVDFVPRVPPLSPRMPLKVSS